MIRLALGALAVSVLAAASAEARGWKPKSELRLELAPTYYTADVGQGTSQSAVPIRLAPEFTWKPTRGLKLHLAPWFFSDPASKSPSERSVGDIAEANVDWGFGDWDLKAGVNSVSWGVTDVFNPLDVVSARRYIDPLSAEKRGVPSVDLSWDNGTWRAEALYVPVQLEAILPGENSRWLPRDFTYSKTTKDGLIILDKQFTWHYTGRDVIENALANNAGFRLERHGSGVDLTAVVFQGASTAPVMFPFFVDGVIIDHDPETELANRITLQPVYYMRRTAGVGAVVTLESTIIRVAAANSDRMTRSAEEVRLNGLPGWANSAVLGIEQNLPIASSTLTILLQGTYANSEAEAENSITSLDRIFDRSWLFGVRLTTSSDWTLNAAVLHDTVFQGWYGTAKVEYKIADGVNASFQGDLIDGQAGTPLGTYRRNDRAILGLSLFF